MAQVLYSTQLSRWHLKYSTFARSAVLDGWTWGGCGTCRAWRCPAEGGWAVALFFFLSSVLLLFFPCVSPLVRCFPSWAVGGWRNWWLGLGRPGFGWKCWLCWGGWAFVAFLACPVAFPSLPLLSVPTYIHLSYTIEWVCRWGTGSTVAETSSNLWYTLYIHLTTLHTWGSQFRQLILV